MATTATPSTSLVRTDDRLNDVRALLTKAEPQIAMALPRGIQASYIIRVALTAVQRNPELLECDRITLLGALFQAAQLGLVPDGVMGQAYLVPFRNTKKNRKEVQFIPGYRGLVTLARRSGELSTIDAEVVREKDTFSYSRGTDPRIEHVPYSGDGEPGPMTYVWAAAKLKDGGFQIVVLNKRQVMKIKARSSSARGASSPWNHPDDEAWMWKKTAIKQLCKLLPISVESMRAVELDTRHEIGLPQDLGIIADPENETATPIDEAEVVNAETIQEPRRKSETAQASEGTLPMREPGDDD